MTQHFRNEIEKIKKKILSLSSLVEERVYVAVRAVLQRDTALLATLLEGDREIDEREVEVEEECLKILALHQPVAIDLRFLIAVLKLNNDLERIADLAVSIANRGTAIAKLDGQRIPSEIKTMADLAKQQLHNSLEALVHLDSTLARQVLASDDAIDALNRQIHDTIINTMRSSPEKLEGLLALLSVSRNLERIADHATNIAEDVIYMVEGEIVRHGKGKR